MSLRSPIKHDNSLDGASELDAHASGLPAERPEKKRKKRSTLTSGIVYISRVPPGMTPQKIRHLMERWGEVGKVYAQRRDAPTDSSSKPDKVRLKHAAANYTEAWVEFLDKSVAKMVALMLNAEVIGGRKGNRWRDDIWTMKYLSGFKWEMLGEQVAYERQAHQSRLRTEIARSRNEQGEYLRNVELARVLEKRKVKKAAADGNQTSVASAVTTKAGTEGVVKKGYKQRQAVEKARESEANGMKNVLGSVFG
ncbi:MAG: RNA-binding ATPase activator esf2 [Tremellales sp. Tagirdzhanova-0007]|nr:MAG: RNA-binding ATPase activator esf2 [Tremellales sp. Tagirdzhanova-0007]